MRGADGGPWRRLCALPAFWVCQLFSLCDCTLYLMSISKLVVQYLLVSFFCLKFVSHLHFIVSYLQVGLLYDEESLQSIMDMTFDWTKEEREMLRRKVCTICPFVIWNIVDWRLQCSREKKIGKYGLFFLTIPAVQWRNNKTVTGCISLTVLYMIRYQWLVWRHHFVMDT